MTDVPTANSNRMGNDIQNPARTGANQENGQNVGEIERWASVLGGSALVLYGLMRRSWGGLGLAATGGALIYRGATGRCPVYEGFGLSTAGTQPQGIHVEKTVTINKPPTEVYEYWHNFENLPRFMHHLESVQTLGDGRSHWVATAPAGKTVAWDAEITEDRENDHIAWRSLPGADVDNAGEVRFIPAPGGRGTEVKVALDYNPPGGMVAATLAKLFGEEPSQQVEKDLNRFKQLMEAGEIPTTDGQPRG